MQTTGNANTIYDLAYWAALCLWVLSEAVGAVRQRRKTRREDATGEDRGSYVLLLLALVCGQIAGAVLSKRVSLANIGAYRSAAQVPATLMLLAGIAFRWYAIHTLGRYFTNDVAVSADQPVIQTGPYRLIRHPAYSGTLLSAAGAGLGMNNWLSLVVAVAGCLLGLLYRIRIEERALARGIGEPYVAYMRRTKRLIPFVF